MVRTRTRIAAAVGALALIGASVLGASLAAQGAPPDAANTPQVLGAPFPTPTQTADRTPQIDIRVNADIDYTVDLFVDGDPYCTIASTGVGPAQDAGCSGVADLSFGTHTFTAVADYAGFPGFPSPVSAGFDVLVYDDTNADFGVLPTPTIDTTPPFFGTGPIGGTITQVYDLGIGTILCTNVPVQPDGTWSCESGVALALGGYTIRLTWTDLGGGGSFSTTAINIVAATPPTVDQTFPDPWYTSSPQISVHGHKDYGATRIVVESSSDGGGSWNTYCDLDGGSDPALDPDVPFWFCNFPSGSLALGPNLLRATEYDELGTATGPGGTIQITVIENPTVTSPAPDLVTNNPQPVFEGTVDPYSTEVTVYQLPGDISMFCFDPAPVAGTWSCTPAAPLPDGVYEFWARGNAGMGLGSDPQTFTIDTAAPNPPVITGPADGSSTANIRPTFSGTADPGTFVNVIVDGSANACVTGPAPVDGFGNWSCQVVDPLGPGLRNVQATATDEADNVSAPSAAIQVTITVPSATIDAVAPWYTGHDFISLQGNNSDDGPITVLVERASAPGGPWDDYCFTDYDSPQHGLTIWFCNGDTIGTFNPSNPLVLGDNYLRVTVGVDGGGFSQPSAPVLITRLPPPTVTSPADGAFTGDGTPTFTGTAPPEASFIELWINEDGGGFICSSPVVAGTWSCSGPVPDGVQEYVVFMDVGGPTSVPRTIVVDTTPPPFPVISTPLNGSSVTDTTPTVSGTAQPGSVVTVWVDGAPASCGSGSFQPAADGLWACTIGPLSLGPHTLAASAVDGWGHASGVSAIQSRFTVAAPPLVLLKLVWKLGTIGSQYLPGDTVELVGTGLPAGAVAEAEIHSTPQFVGSAITDEAGTFVIDAVIPEDIEPGLHTFVITVTADGAETSVLEQPVMIMAPASPPKAVEQEALEKDFDGGAGGEFGDRNDPASATALTNSLDTVFEILRNPIFIATAGGLGLALLLFVAIPAELLNATLSEQYDRLTKRMPRVRAGWWTRFKAMLASSPIVGGLLITVLVSIIFGFADPGFGFDLASLRVVLACAIGLFFVGYLANAITGGIIARRWALDSVMELKPLGVILAVAGVVVSRLLEFTPGMLIGLLIGLSLLGRVSKRDESRTALVKTGVIWGMSILAWIAYSLLAAPLTGTSFAGNLTVEILVAITAEGLTALLIGLLPFKYLEGSAIWDHHKLLWAAVWLGAAASWTIIVLPQSFAEIQGSLVVWGIVVGAFAVIALTIYFIFRFAVKDEEDDEDGTKETETQKARIGSGR